MPYILTKMVLGPVPRLEIDGDRQTRLAEARAAILMIIEIEEAWDSLVASYLELENELATAAVHSTVLRPEGYVQFGRDRLNFTRRMSNLLHSCRAYLDQTARRTGLLPTSAARAAFSASRRSSYDAALSFRVMEALRNHAQHYDVPLHGTSFKARRMEDAEEFSLGGLEYSVTAKVDVERLRDNPAFKASVLAELAGTRFLDVATLCREYVEALSSIHMSTRDSIGDLITGWRGEIQNAHDDYAAVNDGNVLGLAVAWAEDSGVLSDVLHLSEQILEWHNHLVRRNGSLVNLRRRYASTKLQQGET